MRLFLVGRYKGLCFEVMEFDLARHRAVLRGVDGIVVDENFVMYMVKRMYDLVQEEPDCLKEK